MSDAKPGWATAVSALTPLVIGALGLYFTDVYKESELRASQINQERLDVERQQRLLIDKANVIKDYFAYLADKSDENQQRAALTVLATLGYTDLVIKVVTSDPTPSNVQALAAIATTANDSNAANEVIGALESIKRTAPAAQTQVAVEAALTTTQAAEPSPDNGAVVVAGADKSFGEAQFELDRLKKAGFEEAQVVKRGDWYRTIVPVKEPAQTGETLKQIQTAVRPSAYVVDQRKWCTGETAASSCQPARP